MLKELLRRGALHGECLTLSGIRSPRAATARRRRRQRGACRTDHENRRPGRAQGKPRARRRAHQGGRTQVAGLRGPARVFDSEEACAEVVKAELQGRRGAGDPLRRAEGRPGHARDARRHRAHLRPGHGREGGASHRRPLLRRDARNDGGLRLAGSRGRRTARASARRRSHPHRCSAAERSTCCFPGGIEQADGQTAEALAFRRARKICRRRLAQRTFGAVTHSGAPSRRRSRAR